MEKNENVVALLSDIKGLLGHRKKIMNVDDLAAYTGLSKSKIYHRCLALGGTRPFRLDSGV